MHVYLAATGRSGSTLVANWLTLPPDQVVLLEPELLAGLRHRSLIKATGSAGPARAGCGVGRPGPLDRRTGAAHPGTAADRRMGREGGEAALAPADDCGLEPPESHRQRTRYEIGGAQLPGKAPITGKPRDLRPRLGEETLRGKRRRPWSTSSRNSMSRSGTTPSYATKISSAARTGARAWPPSLAGREAANSVGGWTSSTGALSGSDTGDA